MAPYDRGTGCASGCPFYALAPFSLFFGCTSVATFANLAAVVGEASAMLCDMMFGLSAITLTMIGWLLLDISVNKFLAAAPRAASNSRTATLQK